MKHISQAISFLYLILIFHVSYGESLPIENYDEISENIFWNDLILAEGGLFIVVTFSKILLV